MAKTKQEQLLEDAFAEFDTGRVHASEQFPEEGGTHEVDEAHGEDEVESPIEDPDEDSAFPTDEGEEAESAEENPFRVQADDEPELGEGEGEGEEPADGEEQFSLDDDGEDEPVDDVSVEEVDDDAEGAVYASVEQCEKELFAIAHSQGLDKLPKGVTASQAIDYLLATGAIVELKPISTKERTARHAAFAADEFGEDGEDSVESPVGEPEENDEDDFEGIDLSGVEDVEGDPDDDGSEDDPAALDEAADAAEELPPEAPLADAPVVEPKAEAEECKAEVPEEGYEPVADAELLAHASVHDVQMVYAATEDPRWNFIIAGVPAAVVCLSSMEKPEVVRASFATENYRNSVLTAMEKYGVASVLGSLKATFFANKYKTSSLANEIRASVSEELGGDYKSRVIAMREDLTDRVNLVTSGLAKGFFRKTPNPLLEKAKIVLANNGVHPSVVEAAALEIMSAVPEFVAIAADKAIDLMDKDIGVLRENIEDSAPRAVASVNPVQSLGERLAQASLTKPAAQEVTASAPKDFKASLASLVGTLGRKR